jgi:hypothetical protein
MGAFRPQCVEPFGFAHDPDPEVLLVFAIHLADGEIAGHACLEAARRDEQDPGESCSKSRKQESQREDAKKHPTYASDHVAPRP